MKLHSDGVLVIWKWEWMVNAEMQQDSEGCDSIQTRLLRWRKQIIGNLTIQV